MERPRWASVVGVIGALIGAAGILASAQAVFMPKMLDMQREMMSQMRDAAQGETSAGFPSFPDEFFDLPPWFERWSVVNSVVGIALSSGYFLACVLLLIVRPTAIPMFFTFSILSILWHIVRIVVCLNSESLMIAAMLPASIFGLVVHPILLLVAWKSDTAAYAPEVA